MLIAVAVGVFGIGLYLHDFDKQRRLMKKPASYGMTNPVRTARGRDCPSC